MEENQTEKVNIIFTIDDFADKRARSIGEQLNMPPYQILMEYSELKGDAIDAIISGRFLKKENEIPLNGLLKFRTKTLCAAVLHHELAVREEIKIYFGVNVVNVTPGVIVKNSAIYSFSRSHSDYEHRVTAIIYESISKDILKLHEKKLQDFLDA